MTNVEVRVWIDGEEIELSPMIRVLLEKHSKKAKVKAVATIGETDA